MTRVAFYAPMKPPTHPVPSGDRAMGRAILQALEHGNMDAELVSTLQTVDKQGCRDIQTRLLAQAEREATRLITLGQHSNWQVWITYHSYYKAPDLVGPVVAAALKLPYFQIEATRARKRLTGPWAAFAQAAEAASDAADVIFHLTQRDALALRAYQAPHQKIIHLPPFLPRVNLPPQSLCEGAMLSVGMLRHGDKIASYELIADTLKRLKTPDWRLVIAGDGPALNAVASIMGPFGARVEMRGSLDAEALEKEYSNASLLFWPGVNEAFGVTYLEAQAAGLPVVAQDRPGVIDVLAPGQYPRPEQGPEALAQELDALLRHPDERAGRGRAARDHIAAHHLISGASTILCTAISEVLA
ncbi:D-inositol-3-phosphate glycosyltransferase [Roseobacter fucihabitans]|uniref:D-inositol-3-phosphate glycosyltransferase n=1 Tax=Roseobacter fucihabitans TaxID=1537242 RepID=A0ABZ2BW84_9RHOB|nr:glycosyltransferase family 4 protein [Roseobacter litoralis]MBC6964979.1 D-inositol-3-phosphate glycosyltransferase [Roseobacter litoralis]